MSKYTCYDCWRPITREQAIAGTHPDCVPRDRKLLNEYRIVDSKPGDPPQTWRDKLRFHRYLRALLKAAPSRRNP